MCFSATTTERNVDNISCNVLDLKLRKKWAERSFWKGWAKKDCFCGFGLKNLVGPVSWLNSITGRNRTRKIGKYGEQGSKKSVGSNSRKILPTYVIAPPSSSAHDRSDETLLPYPII